MSATSKRKLKEKKAPELPVLNPRAAGVDIGATEIYVAVHPDCDPEPVRCFPTFTGDLQRLADWLKTCGVNSVAMESTGVYWIPLFQILEERGFGVCLVNARYYQNVPGRRTDVSDYQWLPHLHSVGLLRPSFRPVDQVCAIHCLVRNRDSLIQAASSHVLPYFVMAGSKLRKKPTSNRWWRTIAGSICLHSGNRLRLGEITRSS
jgi:hypothetical protein